MVGLVEMSDNFANLDAQLHSFRESDKKRDDLLTLVVRRLHQLEIEYKEKCHDFANERASRLHWQEKFDVAERQLLRQNVENSCFVQVLIDGDGAYFHEALIKSGGAQAAHTLHKEIKTHVESLYPGSEFPIMVNIYANIGGLGGALAYGKVIVNPTELYAFTREFNGSHLGSIVDVGAGKEKADHKLKEMFRVFLANRQCKHIIFGGCHDAGYTNILNPIQHDSEKRGKVTLLETLPAHRDFLGLGFNMTRFPTVFTSEPLERTPSPPKSVLANRSPPTTPVTNSWASTAGTSAHHPEKTISIVPLKSGVSKFILQNASGYRIDPPLGSAPQKDKESLYERIKNDGKLCNEHYLRGKCPNGSRCHFSHEKKLSQGETLALRHRARTLSCPNKLNCFDYNCYLGHTCPFEVRPGGCTSDGCYFMDVHGVDKRATLKLYDDGRTEVIAT